MPRFVTAIVGFCMSSGFAFGFDWSAHVAAPSDAERPLAKRLYVQAQSSALRFDGPTEVTSHQAWLMGSRTIGGHVYHFLAYHLGDEVSYVAVFTSDERLAAIWRFACDARQIRFEESLIVFMSRSLKSEGRIELHLSEGHLSSTSREITVEMTKCENKRPSKALLATRWGQGVASLTVACPELARRVGCASSSFYPFVRIDRRPTACQSLNVRRHEL